ncbi:MAG TPA: type I polyketide synthase, partial [Streptosporangiaceae bacterium]
SFGISGTNAHLILEQPPSAPRPAPGEEGPGSGPAGRAVPWVISARSGQALRDQATRLRERWRSADGLTAGSIGQALARTRSRHDHRAVIIGHDNAQLSAGLAALADGTSSRLLVTGTVPAEQGKTVFVFPGQGGQWPGMAAGLMASCPAFAEHVEACAEAFSETGWPLADVLRGEPGAPSLDRVDVVQPALFAVMTSLARAWQAAGVQPDAVAGHSQGEIAAAYVAGAISLPDAARITMLRCGLIAALAGSGAMASVPLPVAAVETRLARMTGQPPAVAAVNSPASTVVSGDAEAVAGFVAACQADGIRARMIAVDYASHSPQVEKVRAELTEALAGLAPRSAQIAFYSTVTGGPMDTAGLDGGYWYANLRQPVRYEETIRALHQDGYRLFIEASPHPVLTVPTQETLDEAGQAAVSIGSLRRDEGGWARFLTSLAQAHASGAELDWPALLDPADPASLPTYPFQHRHYWLDPAATARDAPGLGLSTAGHPLLGAVTDLPGGGYLMTGRVSADSCPWLADHTIFGSVIMPGSALADLALCAAGLAGAGQVGELTVQSPLVLAGPAALQLRVVTGAPDGDGRRAISIESRPADAPPGADWTPNAAGHLDPSAGPAPPPPAAWPPPGCAPADVSDLYPRLADAGFDYGPAFRGLRAAWTADGEVHAEITLPEQQRGDARHYGIHPALLDAAVHALALLPGAGQDSARQDSASQDRARMAFSWSGVTLHAAGPAALRVSLRAAGPDATGISLSVSDEAGQPVATIGELALRPVTARQLALASRAPLYQLDWAPLPGQPDAGWAAGRPLALLGPGLDPVANALRAAGAKPQEHSNLATLRATLDEGAAAPDTVLLACPPQPGQAGQTGLAGQVRAVTGAVLATVRDWLADDRLAASRLAVITSGAVAAAPGDDLPGLASAAVWGLLRTARAENPGRFALLDTGPPGETGQLAGIAAALASGETELAVRDGVVLVPRLARAATPGPADAGDGPASPLDPDGTVLVTGATGGLGLPLVRHLVSRHGARHLLLVSRSGAAAEGAAAAQADLEALGARVRFASCDVADKQALARLLASVPAGHPVTAVFHAAGTVDGGVVSALSQQRLDAVLAPKADAAWNLHELTRDLPLTAFVLFSSLSGMLGNPGQANYAAGNSFLDALAQHRRAAGLTATSLAWGVWDDEDGMATRLSQADKARMSGAGVTPVPSGLALEMLDLALGLDQPVLAPAEFDLAALRAAAGAGTLPPVLRGLAGPRARQVPAGDGLAGRLAVLPETERRAALLDLVRARAATVLGYDRAAAIDPHRTFADLGFDSLLAVELRNQLSSAAGVRLPAAMAFDHPTPDKLAGHLLTLTGQGADSAGPLLAEISALEAAVAASALDDAARARAADRMRTILWSLDGDLAGASPPAADEPDILGGSDDQLFAVLDQELRAW